MLPAVALALTVPGRSIADRAVPISYTLTLVAKTGDTIGGKTLTGFKLPSFGPNAPAINASGSVAFYATYSQGDFVGEGIFTPTSLGIRTGDIVGGQTVEGISFVPALNDRGTVAVRCLLSSQSLAILTSTTLLVKTGDSIGGQTLTSVGLPAINNHGTVAFVGSFSGGTGIFTQNALLAGSADLIAGQIPTSFGPPAINDRGTVAFQSWFSGRIATAILTPTALLVKTGDTIAGKTLTNLFFGPALNSDGTVAFVGVFSGGTGVFTQKDMLVQAGDKIGRQTLTTFGYPVISDNGVVAFFATYPSGEGIFTQKALIAKTGETIDGRTLVGVGQPVISQGGTVAFAALFSDRSSAIILARPN
jgi:hypothetical protein